MLRSFCRACGEARVVGSSQTSGDQAILLRSLNAGVHGFVFMLGEDLRELRRVLDQVRTQDAVLCLTSQKLLVAAYRQPERPPVDGALDEEEIELLRRAANGATTRQIAGALHMSEGAAKAKISKILRKLGVTSRMAAVTRFMESVVEDKHVGALPATFGRMTRHRTIRQPHSPSLTST
jgi:DNA-binding NarL/FixJ family response regulator